MPKFTYNVKDKTGKTYQNTIDAPNRQSLIESLQRQGYFIISIKESVSEEAPQQNIPKYNPKIRKFSHKKVTLNDLLTFARQLTTMLEAGVTLTRSLDVIQSQADSEKFYNVLVSLKKDVEQGQSLSRSMGKFPEVFNQTWISLIEVGEASGTIPSVLDKLAYYLERQSSFNSTIVSGLIYPAILFGVSIMAIFFFAFFVAPKFESIFSSMNASLPLLTVLLLSFFKFVQSFFLIICIILGILIFMFRQYLKSYTGQLMMERIIFSLKTFGDIYRLIIVERFTSQMAILIDSGVPILYALDICERLVNNRTCAAIIAQIKQGVKSGELLVAPMERSEFFPPMCIQMIMVGEETGELSKMLNHVSRYYQESVETFMRRFSTIVEPVMLIFLGVIIGTIVIAMFLPLFNISQLGGG